MKKLIFSITLLAGLAFIACSKDDNSYPIVPYISCQTCEIPASPPNSPPSDVVDLPYEVCVDADGNAYVDDQDTNILAARYFTLYCANAYTNPGTNPTPGGGNTTNCVTCAAYTMAGATIPATQVCQGENGNGFIAGIDTGSPYATVLAGLQMLTTCQ